MNDDYRLYLDERFKGLHIQMDTEFKMINSRLEKIETQTTKTNGRVTELEKNHSVLTCHNTKRIESVEKDLMEYNFLKKYPKAAVLIISVVVIMFIASCYNVYSNLVEKQKIENTK